MFSRRDFFKLTTGLVVGGYATLTANNVALAKALKAAILAAGLGEETYHLLTPKGSKNPIIMLKRGEDFNLKDPKLLIYRLPQSYDSIDPVLKEIIPDGKITAAEQEILLEHSLKTGQGNYFGWIETNVDAVRFTIMPDIIGRANDSETKIASLEARIKDLERFEPSQIIKEQVPLNTTYAVQASLDRYQNSRNVAEKALIEQAVANYVAEFGERTYLAMMCLYYGDGGSFTQSGFTTDDRTFGLKGEHIRTLSVMYSGGNIDAETMLKLLKKCDAHIPILSHEDFKTIDEGLRRGECHHVMDDFLSANWVPIGNEQAYAIIDDSFNGVYDNQTTDRLKQRTTSSISTNEMYSTNNFHLHAALTPLVITHYADRDGKGHIQNRIKRDRSPPNLPIPLESPK